MEEKLYKKLLPKDFSKMSEIGRNELKKEFKKFLKNSPNTVIKVYYAKLNEIRKIS